LLPAVLDAIVEGWTLARRARSLLHVYWEEHWEVPLEDLRREFDLTSPATRLGSGNPGEQSQFLDSLCAKTVYRYMRRVRPSRGPTEPELFDAADDRNQVPDRSE
jgi:hypothetical protein